MTLNLQGLGDSCPSMEQLQGVVDINDPCQNAGTVTLPSALVTALNTPATPTSSLSLPSSSTLFAIAAGLFGVAWLLGGRK